MDYQFVYRQKEYTQLMRISKYGTQLSQVEDFGDDLIIPIEYKNEVPLHYRVCYLDSQLRLYVVPDHVVVPRLTEVTLEATENLDMEFIHWDYTQGPVFLVGYGTYKPIVWGYKLHNYVFNGVEPPQYYYPHYIGTYDNFDIEKLVVHDYKEVSLTPVFSYDGGKFKLRGIPALRKYFYNSKYPIHTINWEDLPRREKRTYNNTGTITKAQELIMIYNIRRTPEGYSFTNPTNGRVLHHKTQKGLIELMGGLNISQRLKREIFRSLPNLIGQIIKDYKISVNHSYGNKPYRVKVDKGEYKRLSQRELQLFLNLNDSQLKMLKQELLNKSRV